MSQHSSGELPPVIQDFGRMNPENQTATSELVPTQAVPDPGIFYQGDTRRETNTAIWEMLEDLQHQIFNLDNRTTTPNAALDSRLARLEEFATRQDAKTTQIRGDLTRTNANLAIVQNTVSSLPGTFAQFKSIIDGYSEVLMQVRDELAVLKRGIESDLRTADAKHPKEDTALNNTSLTFAAASSSASALHQAQNYPAIEDDAGPSTYNHAIQSATGASQFSPLNEAEKKFLTSYLKETASDQTTHSAQRDRARGLSHPYTAHSLLGETYPSSTDTTQMASLTRRGFSTRNNSALNQQRQSGEDHSKLANEFNGAQTTGLLGNSRPVSNQSIAINALNWDSRASGSSTILRGAAYGQASTQRSQDSAALTVSNKLVAGDLEHRFTKLFVEVKGWAFKHANRPLPSDSHLPSLLFSALGRMCDLSHVTMLLSSNYTRHMLICRYLLDVACRDIFTLRVLDDYPRGDLVAELHQAQQILQSNVAPHTKAVCQRVIANMVENIYNDTGFETFIQGKSGAFGKEALKSVLPLVHTVRDEVHRDFRNLWLKMYIFSVEMYTLPGVYGFVFIPSGPQSYFQPSSMTSIDVQLSHLSSRQIKELDLSVKICITPSIVITELIGSAIVPKNVRLAEVLLNI